MPFFIIIYISTNLLLHFGVFCVASMLFLYHIRNILNWVMAEYQPPRKLSFSVYRVFVILEHCQGLLFLLPFSFYILFSFSDPFPSGLFHGIKMSKGVKPYSLYILASNHAKASVIPQQIPTVSTQISDFLKN